MEHVLVSWFTNLCTSCVHFLRDTGITIKRLIFFFLHLILSACSNWHDFPFQLLDLATPSRTCGQKNFLYRGNEKLTRIQKCHEEDIGFSAECSWYWANNVACSQKNCAFIYIQSLMTNRVADFKVGPHSITSATCSEASCDAGPTYHFVKVSVCVLTLTLSRFHSYISCDHTHTFFNLLSHINRVWAQIVVG